ncbi:MAG: energy transducer TonB [Acetobacteraceae bacterium]
MDASRTFRRRRLTPAVMLSLLAHALLLALAIQWVRHGVEAPEWLPPPSFDVIFDGGNAAKPSVKAPEAQQKSETPPESAPTPPPAPRAAPAAPATSAPVIQPAEPPSPPRVSTPIEPLPPPTAAIETPPPPPKLEPLPRPRALPRPAFPAPMAFSLGGPAAPPSVRRRTGRGIDLSFGRGVMGAEDTRIFGRTDSKEVGPDWFNRFAAWWDRHSYYPPQAGEQNQQGDVILDLVIQRSGRVEQVRLTSGSGSQWLDLAALGVFRGALLPALPSDAAASVPLHLTIHYAIIRR